MFDFQFLGTSAGIPTKTRNVTALAIGQTASKPWLLVDCGEGTQQQLLRTAWSANNLSAICITHVHGDHCYGLPGAIASAGLNKRSAPLTIIGTQALWEWLQHTLRLTDMHLAFELRFVDVASVCQHPHHIDGFDIQAFALNHRVPSYAYKISHGRAETHLNRTQLLQDGLPAGPVWGMLQQGRDVVANGQTYAANTYLSHSHPKVCVLVGGDNDSPELLRDACDGVQVLVHEATYTQAIADKVGALPMHSSAKQTASFAAAVAVPNLVLTHFSARYADEAALQPLYQEAQQHYHGHLFLAADFAHYRLHADGGFHPLT